MHIYTHIFIFVSWPDGIFLMTLPSGWWFGTFFFYFSVYWECHHPNWRTPSFFRGAGQPPTRPCFVGHIPAASGGRCQPEAPEAQWDDGWHFFREQCGYHGKVVIKQKHTNPLVMTNSLPWYRWMYRWPIEIDGSPFLIAWWFSMAMLKNQRVNK